jgi:flagella basal body P-ring formation protein FlgA
MSKNHYHLFCVCLFTITVSGCGLQQFVEQDAEHQRLFESKTKAFQDRLEAKGKALRARADIASGEEVKDDKLEEVETELYRIPIDAVNSLELARGQPVKHEILSGQFLCQHDLICHLHKKERVPTEEVVNSSKEGTTKK